MKKEDSYSMVTPEQVAKELAGRLRRLRLLRQWKQSTLAEHAGVSLASLRRLEQSGQGSLKNLLRLSFALGRLGDYDRLLPPPADSLAALAASVTPHKRKRGSK